MFLCQVRCIFKQALTLQKRIKDGKEALGGQRLQFKGFQKITTRDYP